jgi:hypothetical protein
MAGEGHALQGRTPRTILRREGAALVAAVALALILGAVGIRGLAAAGSATTRAASGAHAAAAAVTGRLWLEYRVGERGDVDPAVRAWLDYRAGERGDVDPAVRAWLDYRAGERGDLAST